jgi:predicted SPOUT superfamily RNA methylase MTH1
MSPGAIAKLCVAVPASLVADTPHLREKTAKLGSVARACAIFGVHEVILYHDDSQQGQQDARFCEQILTFIETPQYLRKRLFGLNPSLKYAGILPPLQIPPHDVPRSIRECQEGDAREGVVITRRGDSLDVDVGLERALESHGTIQVGTRVTVRITGLGKNLVGEIEDSNKMSISQPDIQPIYWGYRVSKTESLGKVLKERLWGLKIGTSRYGAPVQEVLPSLSKALKTSQRVLVAFGSPRMGLREILKRERLDPNVVFDFFVNTAPGQQTATVRTEEAVLVSLGILNLARKSRVSAES